jgi:hypothetical protein
MTVTIAWTIFFGYTGEDVKYTARSHDMARYVTSAIAIKKKRPKRVPCSRAFSTRSYLRDHKQPT